MGDNEHKGDRYEVVLDGIRYVRVESTDGTVKWFAWSAVAPAKKAELEAMYKATKQG